jgi:simple sugar transport system ATP-binding protein
MASLTGITKRFGDLLAVDHVDLDLHPGEVHALLGENGAGKTTLMNVMAGFLAPDEGTIEVGGRPVRFAAPRDALAAGVGMVHQHFRLVEKFTVAENLSLGDSGADRVLDRAALDARVRAWSEHFELAVEPETPVWRLSLGEQQRVEVLRALARGAELLILDEPTSVLTPQEGDALCRTLRRMAADGKTVVFISHKLNEVLDVADRVTVMRRGRKLVTLDRDECDPQMLSARMVGKATKPVVRTASERRAVAGETPALGLSGVTLQGSGPRARLSDVALELRPGEILGVAGVAGNGQQELADVVTGLRRPDSGSVKVAGRELAGASPREFIDAGVAYIPEDRRGTGLISGQPIWRNAILKRHRRAPIARGPLLRASQAKEFAAELVADVRLSTDDLDTPVQHLSGGNAQKLLAGRELSLAEQAIVAVNPTQGLDVAAAADVGRALVSAATRGTPVLLISYDLDELLRLADRLVVIYEGRVVAELDAANFDRDRIGLLMAGVTSPG